MNSISKFKKCSKCGQFKSLEEFYKQKVTSKLKGSYYKPKSDCKDCCRKSANERIYKNKEEIYKKKNEQRRRRYATDEHFRQKNLTHSKEQREYGYTLKWQKSNTDKLKMYNDNYSNKKHKIKKAEWISCKDYFKNEKGEWCCAYCGLSISKHYKKYGGILKNIDLHKEHVSHSGEGDLSNCVPSCHSCNSSKSNLKLEEWYLKQEFYSKERLKNIYKWVNEDYKNFIIL